jgi:penicillin-binding protein 1A
VARYGEHFGLGKLKPVASIGLGSNEVTLLGLTGAYATFANRGVRVPPRPIRSITDAMGAAVEVPAAEPVRVLPRETADLMTGLLEDVVIFGVAYPLRAEYGFTRPVAGKTGTTNDFNDGWFVGFTPELLAGVWVGCDAPRSLGDVAATTALPVWASIVQRLLQGTPVASGFPADSTLELAWIDPWSGGLARGDCPHPMRVPFLPGTKPTRICASVHIPEPDTTGAGEAEPDSAGAAPPD